MVDNNNKQALLSEYLNLSRIWSFEKALSFPESPFEGYEGEQLVKTLASVKIADLNLNDVIVLRTELKKKRKTANKIREQYSSALQELTEIKETSTANDEDQFAQKLTAARTVKGQFERAWYFYQIDLKKSKAQFAGLEEVLKSGEAGEFSLKTAPSESSSEGSEGNSDSSSKAKVYEEITAEYENSVSETTEEGLAAEEVEIESESSFSSLAEINSESSSSVIDLNTSLKFNSKDSVGYLQNDSYPDKQSWSKNPIYESIVQLTNDLVKIQQMRESRDKKALESILHPSKQTKILGEESKAFL